MAHFFVFTAAQRTTAMGFNDPEAGLAINPRLMDAASPGNGINGNGMPQCIVALEASVPLTGKYVSGYEMLTDPEYLRVVPDMVEYILTLPVCDLDPAVIFAPPEEV